MHRIFILLIIFFLSNLIFAINSDARFAYVGSYTSEAPGGWSAAAEASPSEGISVYSVDPALGDLKLIQSVKSENPSFLVTHPSEKYLYVLNEIADYQGKNQGSLEAWLIDDMTGNLSLINRVPCGAIPAQIAVSPDGRFLSLASYMGNDYELFSIANDGSLQETTSVLKQHGAGLHPRQDMPHPHAVVFSPSEKWLLGADLGNDMLKVFQITDGQLSEISSVKLSQETGPRHLSFHPDGSAFYVINELSATIKAFNFNNDTGQIGRELQTVTTVPQSFAGHKSTAEIMIHPSGKFLYGSNRKFADHPLADSLVSFSIGSDKKLKLIEYTTEDINFPRTFVIDPSGTWLYVMNQKGDSIRQYSICQESGKLNFTGFEMASKTPSGMTFKR